MVICDEFLATSAARYCTYVQGSFAHDYQVVFKDLMDA